MFPYWFLIIQHRQTRKSHSPSHNQASHDTEGELSNRGTWYTHPSWHHRSSEWLAVHWNRSKLSWPSLRHCLRRLVQGILNPRPWTHLPGPFNSMRRTSISLPGRAPRQCHRNFSPQIQRVNFYPHIKGKNKTSTVVPQIKIRLPMKGHGFDPFESSTLRFHMPRSN